MLFWLRGKDFVVTAHATQGMNQERPPIDVRDVYDAVAACVEREPANAHLHEKRVLTFRSGRRRVIVRFVERDHAFYVLNVSATTR